MQYTIKTIAKETQHFHGNNDFCGVHLYEKLEGERQTTEMQIFISNKHLLFTKINFSHVQIDINKPWICLGYSYLSTNEKYLP